MAFQSKPNQSVGVYVGEPGHSGNMAQAPLSPTLNQTSAIRIAAIFGAPTLTACEPQRMQLRCRLGVRLHPPPPRHSHVHPTLPVHVFAPHAAVQARWMNRKRTRRLCKHWSKHILCFDNIRYALDLLIFISE